MRIWFAHRICSQAHRLRKTGDIKIHLQPIVDRILDLHLMFGELNLYEESPKGVCADSTEIHIKYSAELGGRDLQHGCVPAMSIMHVNICAEGPPLHYIRSLEVIVFCWTPIMYSIGVGWVRA
jgi:hypothetical protein